MRKEKKYKLSLILKVAGMSKSTYYFLLKKDDFDIKNKDVIEEIKILFNRHNRNYGVRRVTAYLKKKGFIINHKKVHRLMKKFNLSGKKPAQKYHSYQGTVGPVAPNLLERNFSTNGVNEKRTTDVSQFKFKWGKCYFSPIIDMCNGEVVAYDLSLSPNFEQIERMFDSIDFSKVDTTKLIIHSDQGWQYQNPRYVNKLKELGITQSMSRKGNCFDNAIMESFFGITKNEMFYGQEDKYENFEQFKKGLEKYIYYYNNERIKEKTGWLSPVEYRLSFG